MEIKEPNKETSIETQEKEFNPERLTLLSGEISKQFNLPIPMALNLINHISTRLLQAWPVFKQKYPKEMSAFKFAEVRTAIKKALKIR